MLKKDMQNKMETKSFYKNQKGDLMQTVSNQGTLQNWSFNGSQVRTVLINDTPWWVAKDVCDILSLENASMATERLDDEEKLISKLFISGQNRDVLIINESGLYNLIFRSFKPEAKIFRKWVTSEVLPQIRKTGTYSMQTLSRRQIAEMVIEAEKALEEAQRVIAEQAPIIKIADAFLNASDLIPIAEAANVLNISGLGQNRLFKILRALEILHYRDHAGRKVNAPYQRYVDAGYFQIKYETVKKLDGSSMQYPKIHVTCKGLEFLRKRLSECGYRSSNTSSLQEYGV
jgi:anti-repressor protein